MIHTVCYLQQCFNHLGYVVAFCWSAHLLYLHLNVKYWDGGIAVQQLGLWVSFQYCTKEITNLALCM